jgi:histidinol-phosphatase (PHP family)
MKYSCIHTHTDFCDGRDTVEAMCREAWKRGLDSLGFSSHAPIRKKTGFKTNWNIEEERFEEYLDAVREARERWKGRLPVYMGLEVDFIGGLMGPADRDLQELGLDYIIGSVHYVIPPGGAPFTVDGDLEEIERGIEEGCGGDPAALVNCYWDAEEAMIRAGGFDLLGHIDLIKKNNRFREARLPSGARLSGERPPAYRWFSEESPDYRARIAETARLLGERGVPAEINTGGMNRSGLPEPYPGLPCLRLLREQGVPLVINADAHRTEDLDGHYPRAREALLAAGYGETLLFRGRREGKALWEKALL